MSLQVLVLTPDSIFQKENADELVLPTSTGQIGVLPGHAPLITAIDIGPILIRRNTNWTAVALIGGFALIQDNQAIILVNEAVNSTSIDSKEAEEMLKDATNRLQQVTRKKDKFEANFAYKRSRVRYQVATWKK